MVVPRFSQDRIITLVLHVIPHAIQARGEGQRRRGGGDRVQREDRSKDEAPRIKGTAPKRRTTPGGGFIAERSLILRPAPVAREPPKVSPASAYLHYKTVALPIARIKLKLPDDVSPGEYVRVRTGIV